MKYRFTIHVTVECKKNQYRVGKGRLFKSQKATDSETAITWEFMSQSRAQGMLRPIAGAVRVSIWLPKTRKDLINQAETLCDALQGGHALKGRGLVLEDDKQIKDLRIREDQTIPADATAVVWVQEMEEAEAEDGCNPMQSEG